MSKSGKIYKSFMTIMIVAIAAMLIAMGIIAIQKNLKLKTSIDFLPGINVEIFVKNEDNLTEQLIFRNFQDTSSSKSIEYNPTYCELSGNTLTMNSNFVNTFGNNFTLRIKNYSAFKIETNITSETTAYIGQEQINAIEPEITPINARIASGESQDFVVTCEPIIPQKTILGIQFNQLYSVVYDLTNCTTTAVSGEILSYGSSYSSIIIPNSNYFLTSGNYSISGIDTMGYTYNSTTGKFSITDWTKVHGDIVISVTATEEPYSIVQEDFAKDDSIYYKFKVKIGNYKNEDVEWIVAAGTTLNSFTENYNTTDTMLFTSDNYATSKTLGKFSCIDGKLYIGLNPVKQVFLISEFSLGSTYARFNTSLNHGNNFFALYENNDWNNTKKSYIYSYLHDTLMPEIFGDSLANNSKYINETLIPFTQVCTETGGTAKANYEGTAKFFLLGGDQNYNKYQQNDSFSVYDYFSTNSTRKTYHIINKDASQWWLRSGYYYNHTAGMMVSYDGIVLNGQVTTNGYMSVRPCFILNLL